MKYGVKERVLALMLCVCMILPMVMQPMTVYSVEVHDAVTNYGATIGAVAKWDVTSILLASNHFNSNSDVRNGVLPAELPEKVMIVDYAYDEVNAQLWYKVDAAPGYTWPEEYANHHWVYGYAVKIVTANGVTGVFDADGEAVTEITIDVYDKPVLSAESSLQGSVEYQWQIEYEDGKWVDIYGEDEAELTVTIGILASLLDGSNSAKLRCVSESAGKRNVSGEIVVTVDDDAEEEDTPVTPEDATLEVQSNGTAISELHMLYGDWDYSVSLSAVATGLSGNVTYKWEFVKDDGSTIPFNVTDSELTLGYYEFDDNVEMLDDSRWSITLKVTASNASTSVSTTVECYELINSNTAYIETETGEIKVVVAGNIPEDTALELTATESSVALPSDEAIVATLDITLRNADGTEWQPAEGETVEVTVSAEALGLVAGDYFTVYHVHDGEVYLLGPSVVDEDGYATFEVVGFSIFAISTSFDAVIGSTATFVDATAVLNSAYDAFDGSIAFTSDLPAKVVVLEYAFDDVTCKTYVKIDAAPGYTWPAEYAGLHWVESTELVTVNINGEAGIYDADGNPIEETTMGVYDEPTYTASSTLQGEVTYQWQICYDTENDLWVDIYGQTSADVKLTVGMLASRLDADGKAYVRCVVSDALRSAVSSELAITVFFDDEDQGGEGEGEEDTYTADITIDGEALDSVEVYCGDYDFEAVLGATTNLTGDLTYSWDVYYKGTAYNLSTESTLEVEYMDFHWYWEDVDDWTRKATVVLTVSDGTNTCESTFVIYEVTMQECSLMTYSLMSEGSSSNNTALAAEANEYTVTITYKYENGEQAYEYFTGEVSSGVNLTGTVTFPVIPGYEPWLNGEQVDSLELNVIGNDTTADILYEVVYKPALVNVTVIVEHQNVYDDGYTQVATKTIQRLTGSYIETITEFTDDYPGFYQLEHSKPEVAANGTTEVTIRFNRLYFLMRFDLGDGGYGVQPVYARYGTEVEVPDPKSPGYIFLNWKSYDGSTVNSTGGMAKFTMPAYDCIVTAIWEATDVNYTIVYWKENADPNADGTYGYSYWTSEVVPARAGDYVSGGNTVADLVDDERYFTYNDARTDKNVLVKGDSSTVVNVYYTRNSYTIYFTGISGTCVLDEHTHGTGCNSYLICGKETHTHDERCGDKVLSCGIAEHTHSEACCTKEEHTVHTLDCCTATHVHSASCYTITYQYTDWWDQTQTAKLTLTAVQDDPTDNYNAVTWDNGIVRTGGQNHRSYFIQLDGTWYQLSYPGGYLWLSEDTELSGAVSCTKVHVHYDEDCTCSKESHTHGDGNCSCTIVAHTHTDLCYTYSNCSGTVHTHTDACYSECTLVEHTHDNSCTSNSDDNVIYVVTAKYEATIGNVWPTADKFPNITLRGWSVDGLSATAVSKRINMTSDLCDTSDGVKYAEAVTGGTKTYLYYMFESFDQTSPANGNERILRGSVYYDKSELYYQEVNSGGDWNQKEIMGMSPVSNGVGKSGSNVFLYYNRLRYTLKFQNIDEVIYTENQVMFEMPLSYYLDAEGNYIDDIIPAYPDSLEDGAYEFAGWYTTPECFEGTKFDFTTGKMPNGDLTLFAKWAPVKHNVTFYTYKDAATGNLMEKIGNTVEVPHGSKINEQYIPKAPDDFNNGQYTFDGWFYMDNGVEKAFSFKDMTVTQDLNVYARWISNKEIKYVFHFKLADRTPVADPVSGSGLAGETVTVAAKGGTALYALYQKGYFPDFKSSSILLDIDDEDGLMEYTFIYEPVDAVPYTVYYVAETLKEGGTSLGTITRDGKTYHIIAKTEEYSDNRKSHVVEQFKPVSGYLPDAYQKDMSISRNETNEIIFYYSVDSIHAYYKITHYIQNLDKTTWSEFRVTQSQGMIDTVYSADAIAISGFTYVPTVKGTVTSGKLTTDGLELKLYYVRNEYPYKVVYKVQETDDVLYDSSEDGPQVDLYEDGLQVDVYEEMVSHTAPGTYGIYDLVGDATKTIMIRVEEDLENPALNVIIFYYTERTINIDYVIVGPDGTQYDENQTWGELTSFRESVKISSGNAVGSTASAPSTAYKFVGWYSDAACTKPVSYDPTNNKFVPSKVDGVHESATYYAKFEYNLTNLTIVKSGAEAYKAIDPNQTFMFDIFDSEGNLLTTVTVHGDSWSVTVEGLTVGEEYTVTEKTDWSWRYNCTGWTFGSASGTGASATITMGVVGNQIKFTNNRGKSQWLDGDSWCDNIFG